MKRLTIKEQVKHHLVAIISLVAAVGGFMFDTWRDHQNEINQNMRSAAFVVLQDLGELQTLVNYAHFEANLEKGNPIDGWKYAVQVRDLSHLLNVESKKQGQLLFDTWQTAWPSLATDQVSEQAISQQIAQTRQAVLNNIDQLN